jgi:hypothetical protein
MTSSRDAMLDALTAGHDVASYRDEARSFLADLADRCGTPDLIAITLPVARRLLAYPDWRVTMTPDSLIAFCDPHSTAWGTLEMLSVDAVDAQAIYLMGIVEMYRDHMGRPSWLEQRPDLQPPPNRRNIDYLAITRQFG